MSRGRPITVLISGLTMDFSKTQVPGMDVVRFGQMLETSMNRLHHLPDLRHIRYDFDPSVTDPASPLSLAALKRKIRQGPAESSEEYWDAHVIGAGLKKIPQLTPLFEELVNETVAASAGRTKLLFLETGNDHLEVVGRGFPELDLKDAIHKQTSE